MICSSIEKVEALDEENDVLRVSFDNGKLESYFFFNYADALDFINQDVIVTFRKEVYKQNIVDVVNTIVVPSIVPVLERESNIKLYPATEDSQSNVCFAEFSVGDSMTNAIMYCISMSYESSAKAIWCNLVVRDRTMRISTIKVFDYEFKGQDFSGQYVIANIRKTKFGYNSDCVDIAHGVPEINPDVAIAKDFVLQNVMSDGELIDSMNKLNLIEALADFIDIDKGYLLVKLAHELSLADELSNMVRDIDIKKIKRALVMDKSYVVNQKNKLSPTVKSVFYCLRSSLVDKNEIACILDPESEEETRERMLYTKIKEMACITTKLNKEELCL